MVTSISRLASLATLAAVSASITGTAMAAEYGTVVSARPVTAQVPVPQSQCVDEQQLVQQRNSGGGALVGALIGGALGNSMGAGFGRAAATGLGVVAGAAVGDGFEAANNPPVAATVRRCNSVTRYENRVIGYDVAYDYNGQRYQTRTAQPPGERIALNVTVAAAESAPAVPTYSPPVVQASPYVEAPAPVISVPYPYSSPYPYPGSYGVVVGSPGVVVAPRVVIGAGYYGGYYGGYGGYGGGHRHWH
jgi:uncharacterized protein YcfJ